MATCSQTNAPELNQGIDECNGKKVKTNCVYSTEAIPSLLLGVNYTQEEFNQAVVAALTALSDRVLTLESI